MTDDIPLYLLFIALGAMLSCSGFFSMSETCMMALNRYRLKHLAKQGSRSARLTQSLLDKTDELLAFILAGNTVINVATSILVAEICRRLFGDGKYLLAVSTFAAALFILVFAEILPKVFGAKYAEPLALTAAYPLSFLIKLTKPLMFLINTLVRGILKLLGERTSGDSEAKPLNMEELRTFVLEGGHFIPTRQQGLLENLFELQNVTVDDVMTPRSQVDSVDLADKIEEIRHTLATSHHSRVVVTDGGFDHVVGVVHVRKVHNASHREPIEKEQLQAIMRPPFYVPESTPALTALTHMQEQRRQLGMVVDEYGVVKGIVTFHDLLEEVVGEFAGVSPLQGEFYKVEADGSIWADGACPLRTLNRKLGFNFSLDGPKTLNGLIIEQLEDMPTVGISLKVEGYPIEIMQVQNRMVRTLKLAPVANLAQET